MKSNLDKVALGVVTVFRSTSHRLLVWPAVVRMATVATRRAWGAPLFRAV